MRPRTKAASAAIASGGFFLSSSSNVAAASASLPALNWLQPRLSLPLSSYSAEPPAAANRFDNSAAHAASLAS